ncbi:N-acetylneuraminate-9-phosphate synthase-like [Eucyclogobius newberryi]|uniref:N-acetylneuraminate-9-phosphate synthase-like n=1 Tax=Eucyclogobius newberryi TaxID=166745 RepID=UPI003B5A2E4A
MWFAADWWKIVNNTNFEVRDSSDMDEEFNRECEDTKFHGKWDREIRKKKKRKNLLEVIDRDIQGKKKGRPMVVSSGMQFMETMRRIYQTMKKYNQNFAILQCTSAYPLDAEDFGFGYSGHETGISISVAAVALAAKIVERHVTLDKTWKGNDHEASLLPTELAELVCSIRLVERALGSGIKLMLPCEKPCHDKLGKSVVAKVKIPKRTVLSLDMLTVKVAEPKGVAAEDIFQLVGKSVTEDVDEDESVTPEVVDGYGKRLKA